MTSRLVVLATALTGWLLPSIALSQPVELPGSFKANGGPFNHAVQLPPQTFDVPPKFANNEREHYGQWSISAGIYLMQPVFDTNPGFIVNSPGGNFTRQVGFNHNLEIAPNVWLGYVSERGWGARARWFQFDHDAGASYAAAPRETIVGISPHAIGRVPIAGTIFTSSNLAVNVADFQATCNFDDAKWSHLLGIGVRYTHMSQDYRATLSNAGTQIDLTSGHNLNGAGPSFSVETKRRIGETHFAIYGQLHGAILFGRADEIHVAVNNGVAQQLVRDETRVLPVGELEVGAEYERNAGRAKVFLQAGFVGQIWWNGGNASNLDALAMTSASHSNFGFIGLAVRVGVRF
jgi:hypothetical protein